MTSTGTAPKAPTASELANMTPDSRDRAVDFFRLASIITVVLGHWLMAVVIWHGDSFHTGNVLGMVPGLWLATWLLQVMPIFFFVGGFANLVTIDAQRRKGLGASEFLASRVARLMRPVVVLTAVWLPLAFVIERLGVPADVLSSATRLVCQPLWFIGVYLLVTALAPAMRTLHARRGAAVPVALAALALTVDITRFGLGAGGIAYLNLVFVWLFAQQLGFFYADGSLVRCTRRTLVAVAAGAVAVLGLLTTFGPYPRSMVGLPGEKVSNMSPPTFCLIVLTVLQVALVMLARPALQRGLRRERVWTVVVAGNGVIMTVFLWHLTALLFSLAVLYHVGFPQAAGGTTMWWITRPPWIACACVPLAALVALFGRFERPGAVVRYDARGKGSAVAAGFGITLLALGVIGLAGSNFADLLGNVPNRLAVFDVTPLQSALHALVGWWLLRLAVRRDHPVAARSTPAATTPLTFSQHSTGGTLMADAVSPHAGARRTGATWVAATGAFLLLAAASVFVATRWDHIPDAVKLAVLVGITGACALTGDRLRRTLPATGNALFHLGALLVPVDGAALFLHAGMGWRGVLLADSLLAAGALTVCAGRARSVVLTAAASAAVVVVAAGVAVNTDVPAPLVLAVFAALAAWHARTERHALVWASIAGLAPISTLALDGLVRGREVVADLGLLGVRPWIAPMITGVIVAAVVVRSARRRGEPALALIAIASIAAQGIAAWNATSVPHAVAVLAAPSLFVLVQLAVLAARRDSFWARPGHFLGVATEAIATIPTMMLVPATLVAVYLTGRTPHVVEAIGLAVVALGWIVAGIRRETRGRSLTASFVDGIKWWAAEPAAVACVIAAVAFGTTGVIPVAAVALALAVLACARREGPIALVFAIAGYGSILGLADPRVALVSSLVAAAILAAASLRRHLPRSERTMAVLLALVSVAAGEIAALGTAPRVPSALAWIVACFAIGIAGDRLRRDLGDVARLLAFAVVPITLGWSAPEMLAPMGLLAVAVAFEAYRQGRRELAFTAIAPMLQLQLAVAAATGLDAGPTGLALCITATVWLGLAGLVGSRWSAPLAGLAGCTAVVGVLVATADPRTTGPALLIAGALILALGLFREESLVMHAGAATLTVGAWIALAAGHIFVSELYVVPVALHLLVTGAIVRRNREHAPGSWVAYGPAIGLLSAAAFAERLGGGSAWHSLFAGGVGVVAVAIGGHRRLSAPLLLGTATLIAVVGRESFDTAAGVPTWAWLAAGGSALIGTAVVMERKDVSPIQAGRRVVEVLAAGFR